MMLWKGGGVWDREQPDGCSGAALPPPTGAGSTAAGGAARGGSGRGLESLPGEFQAYLAAALVAVPTAKEPSAPM